VYRLVGRQQEQVSKPLEAVRPPTIGEAASCGSRLREQGKLQAMLLSNTHYIDGLAPKAADELNVPDAARYIGVNSSRLSRKLLHGQPPSVC